MAIGRTFEEAVQKAVRMLETGAQGVTENHFPKSRQAFLKYLRVATSKRVFAIAEGLKRGISVAEIYKMTGIDPWFIYRIKNIVNAEQDITHAALDTLNRDTFIRLKQLGFSDKKIAILTATSELTVRARRLQLGIVPSVFQIDTMAGEVPARTNCLYLS